MAEEQIDDTNITNGEEIANPEILAPELELPTEPELEKENVDIEVLKQENEELKKKNQELYEISKKAKGLVRDKNGNWVKKEQPVSKEVKEDDLSPKEWHAVYKANVDEEDVEEVKLYARSHNIDVSSALKTPELKAILGVKAEYRKTAEATAIGSTRRGTSKISDEALLANARKGNVPQDEEGIARLAKISGVGGVKKN